MVFQEILDQMAIMIANSPEADKLSQMMKDYAAERPNDYNTYRSLFVIGPFIQDIEERVDARIPN